MVSGHNWRASRVGIVPEAAWQWQSRVGLAVAVAVAVAVAWNAGCWRRCSSRGSSGRWTS